MSNHLDDDMPMLEAEPLLFTLSHLSEAASTVLPMETQTACPNRRQGQKRDRRKRGEEEEEDTDSDEDFDSDPDEESAAGDAAAAAAVASPFLAEAVPAVPATTTSSWTDGDVDSIADGAFTVRRSRPMKDADIDGVARAEFPTVQTIHASAWLGQSIDVKTVARRCINAVFVPPSGVRLTLRHPSGIAMVYTSGKYVCLGGKSTVDMLTIARKVARKIQRIGQQPGGEEYKTIGFHNFSLNNVSASAALGYRLNLRMLSEDPAFMDYTEYEPEQWKGLHYRLPVDPTKTLADLLPSYAVLLAQRQRAEQFSDEQFLGTGDIPGRGGLTYYSTTTTTGSRSTPGATAAGGAKATFKVPPSLNGQILTATIYSNGRMTLTGVRREKDIFDAYLRFWRILQPFAQSIPPPHPPQQPPYPRIFLPGQRRRIKQEQVASTGRAQAPTEAEQSFPVRDIKPNVQMASTTNLTNSLFTLPAPSFGVKQQAVSGTFAVKPEFLATAGRDVASAIVIEGLPEGGETEKSKTDGHTKTEEEEVEWE